MSKSSKSTKLLNCIIALTTKTPDFPSPLYDNGYQIEVIEPRILLSDGSQSNPDIQLKKNDDYLLFFECKDGFCEKDQLDRYKRMTCDDIKRTKTSSLSSSKLYYDLSYFCTKESEDKLIPSIDKDGNIFPIIVLDSDKIFHHVQSKGFNNKQTEAILKEIKFDKPVPESFIPFTVDDSNETITIFLLQHFMSRSGYEFTLDTLLQELFSHLIFNYSRKSKDELKARIGQIITGLKKRPDIDGAITQKGDKYKVEPSGPKKFRSSCMKIITQYEEQQNKITLQNWMD
ncbi:Uncharacterised protein [uncultured archaeon]|nr:Uncharacterised protein [uncultured archaeon]